MLMTETFKKLESLAAWVFLLAGVLFFAACSGDDPVSGDDEDPDPDPGPAKSYYFNPVIRRDAPDPTVLRAQDGMFYLYSTNSSAGSIPIYRSADLVNWDLVGAVFNSETYPQEPAGAQLWAPEARYMNGKYVVFYSMARMNEPAFSTLGYAVSDRPDGGFVHTGIIGNSASLDVRDAIDPFLFEENGVWYFLTGSFSQIKMYELDVADDLSSMTPILSTKKHVAGGGSWGWFEASSIYKHDGYYYYIASIGGFSFGSGYTTVMARSTSLRGPYMTRDGRRMTDNAYEVMISGDGVRFSDTGHNSQLLEDDAGNVWIIYHGYQIANTGLGRCIFLDRVYWDEDGWPYVKGGHASTSAEAPVIIK